MYAAKGRLSVMAGRTMEAGVPQPPFAVVRTLEEARAALARTGAPAVVKPVDSGGQRGVVRVDGEDDLAAAVAEALRESACGEAIVEAFVDGMELNGIVVARGGTARTLCHRHAHPVP